jgi:hypothetical protein
MAGLGTWLQLHLDPYILSSCSGVAFSAIRSLIFEEKEYYPSDLGSNIVKYSPMLQSMK